MARQKPSAPQHIEKKEPTKEESEIEDIESLSDDEDIPEGSPDELCGQGQILENANQLDDAIQYFEWAVRKKVIELSENADPATAELMPEMGIYWLRYGDALFSRLEASDEIFGVEKPDNEASGEEDDDAKLAWEAMDTARVCFDQLLASGSFVKAENPRLDNLASWLDWAVTQGTPWVQHEFDEATSKALRAMAYCRVRLGDFKMGFQVYEQAVEEFASSVKICAEYGLSYAKGLEAALPLAQCLMALQSPQSVPAFKTCLKLIEAEKSQSTLSPERATLLDQTYEDLSKQLEEYESVKGHIGETLKEAVEHVQGGFADEEPLPQPDPTEPVLDLGVVSKRRRKENDQQFGEGRLKEELPDRLKEERQDRLKEERQDRLKEERQDRLKEEPLKEYRSKEDGLKEDRLKEERSDRPNGVSATEERVSSPGGAASAVPAKHSPGEGGSSGRSTTEGSAAAAAAGAGAAGIAGA
ncbi:hypothetical protein GNI_077690 [Gregarina niphandrodes]|uniref:Tetratricopeptide repeat protein n=1 Tax=Gregarina niphandrodes TaxID=110365 RepID=A0A023B6Q7_GRENI|nr:hypothetical protein GNI_077690 [Gregarina niphandrodes]EZG66680.1 hypothetical protein GNI_077690 [Gregarina niphandrodes]|eukprot:XP_011130531.1 hypothetical protein GNI_077690 [Gregarina niphandrodes]